MTDNPHPLWRQERCEQCRIGNDLEGGFHFIEYEYRTSPADRYRQCTAPTEAEFVDILLARLDELTKELEVLRGKSTGE